MTNKWLKKVQKKYALKEINTHAFRHTHCSLALEANLNLKEIQDRLGHTDIQTTINVYVHLAPDKSLSLGNKIGEHIGI